MCFKLIWKNYISRSHAIINILLRSVYLYNLLESKLEKNLEKVAFTSKLICS